MQSPPPAKEWRSPVQCKLPNYLLLCVVLSGQPSLPPSPETRHGPQRDQENERGDPNVEKRIGRHV